jgi:hypothetical protein
MINDIEQSNNDKDYEELKDMVNELEDLIFGEEGILEELRKKFKTDLKSVTVSKIELLKSRGKTVFEEVTDEPCVVFCTLPDLVAILGNLVHNIEKATSSNYVFVKLYRNSIDYNDVVVLELYNDSVGDTFNNGIGINNSAELAKKYSGVCTVSKLDTPFFNDNVEYNVLAKVIFKDLADSVLNKNRSHE